ncbi:reverse transcriptase family protein [Pseudomonas oryzihabitans]|uniref:reverse transcriptase family protein n=1 Tax=Pseudomonas oryzihabitans TaxID=47885 RepID=UPI003B20B73D
MEAWSVHHLSQKAEPLLGQAAADDLKAYALRLRQAGLPVIFSLGHLSKIVGVDYSLLRASVERRREAANYRMFAIKKRSGGRRHIHAVTGELFKVQQFINSEILQKRKPHAASFAFHPDGGIRACASEHCGARWLFQFDLSNFFHSVSEADVYGVLVELGYRPLLAFEMARICTTTRLPEHLKRYLWSSLSHKVRDYRLYVDRSGAMGVLPQGAPTSPMLSNLAARNLDEALTAFSTQYGFVYTRYADDITLSSGGNLPEGISIGSIHRSVIGIIRKSGFRENPDKTRIAGPGSKKLVLGLLVDGEVPRVSKETLKRIDRHLHAAERYGLVDVAKHEKFDSPIGFYNHLEGLIAFVKDVERGRWEVLYDRFSKLQTPMNVGS